MNLLEHPQDHLAVAQAAAGHYGQQWNEIGSHIHQRWLEAIIDAAVTVSRGGSGQTELERCACQAVRDWVMARVQVSQQSQETETPRKPAKLKNEIAKPVAKAAAKKPEGKVVKAKPAKTETKPKRK